MNDRGQQQMQNTPIDVHFSCQRCCQPLKLHSSLSAISKETFLDLTSRNPTKTKTSSDPINYDDDDELKAMKLLEIEEDKFLDGPDKLNSSPASLASSPKDSNFKIDAIYKKTIHPFRSKEKLADYEYSLINDPSLTGNLPANSITTSLLSGFDHSTFDNQSKNSKDLRLQIKLFDILSEQSDIDHPLCEECANFVIEQMDNQLVILERECNEYETYYNTISSQETPSDEEIANLNSQLESMQITQASMIKDLKDLNKKQKELDGELERQVKELKRVKTEEDKYWHEYNNVKFNYFQYEDEQQTLDNKLRYCKEFYKKLNQTNVFNSTFYIWYNGPFGTINGFRLGRLPGVQVDWHEINAAWGQCALLLSSLANKIRLTFVRYKIVPYGNYSFIESIEEKPKQLPLYTSGGLKYYFHQKFDQAMAAFLDCLQQFNDEMNRQDNEFSLPYKMDSKGFIYEKTGDVKYSIRINVNTEEQWTKALKFMLTNLKWALAWVSNTHGD